MMHEIVDEIQKAGRMLSNDQVLLWMPCYLSCSGAREDRNASFGTILEELEKKDIFAVQSDGWLVLQQEYGKPDGRMDKMLGFADETGKFYSSLEQWISYLARVHSIDQGILLLRMQEPIKELMHEDIWWNQFFRQIKKHKRHFLFILEVSENMQQTELEWLERRVFCKKLVLHPIEIMDYLCELKYELLSMGFRLDEGAEKEIARLLEQYQALLDESAITNWKQELLWEFILSEPEEAGCILAGHIKEESLRRYVKACIGNGTIGFNT